MQRRLSLEGGAGDGLAVRLDREPEQTAPQPGVLESAVPVPRVLEKHPYETVARVMHDGPVPLLPAVPGMADRERLRIAMLIPPFGRGSGGHNTLFQILSRLEQRGHICSVWVADLTAGSRSGRHRVIRREIVRLVRADRGARVQGIWASGQEPTS